MGYRKYAKDYEIEYVDRLDQKKPKAVRIYVGPYFVFSASPAQVQRLRWMYTLGLLVLGAALLIPLCIDTATTRTWYVQVPASAAWIPWMLALGALWRLWTAGEKVDREHYDLLYPRLSGALVGVIFFCGISLVGCAVFLFGRSASGTDLVVLLCDIVAVADAVLLFSHRKGIRMTEVENPEKPQAKKK